MFLAPFRLYCKLVRRPGQRCSSAPWAPCRMQPSYRSFTVHHGVWFWLAGFHSNAAATGSLLGGRSSAGGTMSLVLSPSGNRCYDFSHTNNDFLYTRRRRAHRYRHMNDQLHAGTLVCYVLCVVLFTRQPFIAL